MTSDELAKRRAAKETDGDWIDRTLAELFRLGTGIEALVDKWADDYPEVSRELKALLRPDTA